MTLSFLGDKPIMNTIYDLLVKGTLGTNTTTYDTSSTNYNSRER